MDSRITGYLSEMAVVEKLLSLGYQVLQEVIPCGYTDYWIRCDGDKYIKIQVKTIGKFTCKRNNRAWTYVNRLNLSHSKRKDSNYKVHEVDYFIGVKDKNFFVVPYRDAYEGNENRRKMLVSQAYVEAWHLLPRPFKHETPMVLGKSTEEVQGKLFVA